MSINYTYNLAGQLVDSDGKIVNNSPYNIVDPVTKNILFSSPGGVAKCGVYCAPRPIYEYIVYVFAVMVGIGIVYYLYTAFTGRDSYLENKIRNLKGTLPTKPDFPFFCGKDCKIKKTAYNNALRAQLKISLADAKLGRAADMLSTHEAVINSFGKDLKNLKS